MSRINISISSQQLELIDDDEIVISRYSVSTSKNGPGEVNGSFCTPRGRHIIRAKIGAGAPPGTVFVKRRATGEIYSSDLADILDKRDWILTRILWLSGCELGFNRMGRVDTMRRCIYIHGSPDHVPIGRPGSIGCIRMRNADIIELFDQIAVGTEVTIKE